MKPDIFDEFDKNLGSSEDYYDELWFNAHNGGEGQLEWWTKDNWKKALKDWIQANFIEKKELREKIEGMKTDIPDDGYKPGELTSLSFMGPSRAYNQAIDDILKLL